MNKKTDISSRRNLVKSIKFSPAEFEKIQALAAEKGLDFSTYIREAALSGNMPEDYYQKKYLCRLVRITDGVNQMHDILNVQEVNIGELRKIVNSMDKEMTTLWRY